MSAPKTDRLLLSDDTMTKKKEERGLLLFSFLVLAGRDPNSRLLCERGRTEQGQHTGLRNLISCFICLNLFLNQSGGGRKPSSWAVNYTALSRCPGVSDAVLPLRPLSHRVNRDPV